MDSDVARTPCAGVTNLSFKDMHISDSSSILAGGNFSYGRFALSDVE